MDGWKLVPVEPTEEMIYAIATRAHCGDSGQDIWSEALAYAPVPPAGEVEAFKPSPWGWVAEGRFFSDRQSAIEAAEKTAVCDVYNYPQITRLTAENNLLRHDVASFLETMAKTCELLGIDLESAKSAEDKPSDVLFEHAKRLAAERDRHAHNSKEWESASLHWMAEYDKVKSELTKARELLNRASGQLEVCAFGLREIATSKRVTALNLRQMAKSTLNSAAGIADQSTPAAKPLLVECDVCPTSGGCVESCMKAPAAQHEDK